MSVLVRGALASAGLVAVLTASGCGGGTTVNSTVSTQASVPTRSTISVPSRVLVMDSSRQRLMTPSEFSFRFYGTVAGKHLHWAGWGKPTASADGLFSERRFSSSNRVHFRSSLKLTQLRVCEDAEYYTRAVVPLPSSGPFRASVTRLKTPCG